VAGAITVVTVWLVYAVWRSPHRDDLATFGAYAAAVAVIAAGLIGRVWRNQSTRDTAGSGLAELDRLTDLLAGAVKEQWTRAAADRGLLEPEPIPVRWEKPSLPLAGPTSAAAGSRRFPPLPGLAVIGQQQLRAGRLRDLHAVYGGLGSGRMVIAGAPGSGKSGAAVLLLLDALRYRAKVPAEDRPQVPVPVMFTVDGWNPNSQQVEDWLVARLKETYPLFTGKYYRSAAELLRAGKIAVILDGLDEVSSELRPTILRALSEQATFRLVVLTRSTEMAAAVRQGPLAGAVALELQDVDPRTAADYLASVQIDPPPHGWRELTDRLRGASGGPLAMALSNPLTLTLVRDTYRGTDDVSALLEFCDGAGPCVSREDIEDHLLDRVLPAAYARRPGHAPPRYELETAQRTLTYIAARMNHDGTRNLLWWHISAWTPQVSRVMASRLVCTLAFGTIFGVAWGVTWGLVPGIVFGLIAGLLIGPVFGSLFGEGGGYPGTLASRRWQRALWSGFSGPGGNAIPLSPRAFWKGDRVSGLLSGVTYGLAFGLIAGFMAGSASAIPSNHASGLMPGFLGGLASGLAGGLVGGLALGMIFPETWTTSLAFAQLALRSRAPFRLMRFLEDARERNVLRTVGPIYQFRHVRLQDRLADQN